MSKLGPIFSRTIAISLLGGAIVLSAASPALADRGNGYRDHWRSDSPRRAAEMCRSVAEREVRRQSYGRANVTDIRDVRETRWGYEVRGRIEVVSRNRGWNDRDRWSNGNGYRDNYRNYDDGSFKCRVERGRIAHLDFSGIRGL